MAKSNMGLRKITFTIILLCVVRSFVAEKNVAVGKPSQQSSKYNDVWVAKNVVDGCVNTSIGSGCCTHTNTEDSSGELAKTVWWRVNLEQMMTINRITIYYRDNFQRRLAGYELYVSNSTSSTQDGTLCFTDTSTTNTSVQLIVTHQCPYVGQYVTVYNYRNSNKRQPWYSNDAVLELCEVQVWGCPAGKLGVTCETDCPSVCYGGNCNSSTAACFYCFNGKFGEFCNQDCSTGCKDMSCEKRTGHCYDCVTQKYGPTCDQDCSINCQGRLCNRNDGHCFDCVPRKHGVKCEHDCSARCKDSLCYKDKGNCYDCDPQRWGLMCEHDCSSYCKDMICDKQNGNCTECIAGRHGHSCDQLCSENCHDDLCERYTGFCKACIPGKFGGPCADNCPTNCKDTLCEKTSGHCIDCNLHKYGVKCEQNCSTDCLDRLCDKDSGNCYGCIAGKHGNTCDRNCSTNCKDMLCGKDTGNCIECHSGKYGATCGMDCPGNCNRTLCEQNTGYCKGCVRGSYGVDCSKTCGSNCLECEQQNGECTECAEGLYGTNCSLSCGHCSICQIDTGVCVTPCDDGYQGDLCATRQAVRSEESASSVDVGPIVGAVVGVVVVGIVAIVIVLFIRRRRLNAERQKPLSNIAVSNENLYLQPDSTNRRSGVTDSNIYRNISEQEEPSEAGASVYMNTGLVEEAFGSGDVYYNSFPIGFPVSELKSIVETKMKNKAKAFEDEYNSIPSGDLHKHATGTLDHNKVKNRFKTTFPYDHSRVILDIVGTDPHTDYINANYIDSVTKPALYVATQGPRPGTVNDFWRMIWQLQTGKIVMLTNLIEGGKPKCDKYWPDEGEKPLDTPHFYIALERERAYAFYVIRDFKVTEKKTKTVRQVHQFHYTTWPDHGTPDPNELVVFHRRVKNYEAVMKGRMVVHCSAGIGRTGTFIALDALLEYGKETERIDVLQYIKTMRKDRVNMVQTVEQYIAVHQLLLEAFDMPDTLIPRMKFHSELSALSNGGPTNQTKLRQEYQMTQSTKPNYGKNDYRAALLPSNQMKNRTLSVLAADRFRTYLQSHSSKRTDYINAVMLPSYTSKTGYIVTQTPLDDTVVDLLTMIMDHNCHTLVVIDTDAIEWLPSDGGFKTFSNYRLDHKGKSSTVECLDLHALEIENSENNTSLNLRVFHMTGWDRDSPVPKDSSVLLQLLELVDSRRKSDDTKTTIVMCRDGHSQSGLFCCISNARDQMKCDEEVDIYQISRQLLVRRPEFLINFDQYQCCYTMLRDYLDTDDVYIN